MIHLELLQIKVVLQRHQGLFLLRKVNASKLGRINLVQMLLPQECKHCHGARGRGDPGCENVSLTAVADTAPTESVL